MKNKYTLLIFFLLCSLMGQAQDIIFKLTGEEIKAKVEEITLTDILYRLPDSMEGPQLSIPKSEVFMVKFANGQKEVFAEENEAETVSEELTPQQMAELGRQDARLYYKGHDAMWGSAGSLFVLSLAGPIIIAAVPPKIKPKEVSNLAYLSDPDYTKAYRKQAHKRKVGKAALGGAIGVGITFTAALIFVASLGFN